MGSLPKAKAGVGSAVNDATRQVGGALGVAVIGSVMAGAYRPRMAEVLRGQAVPAEVAGTIKGSLGGALGVAREVGGESGRLLGEVARQAFVDGMQRGLLVSLVAGLAGAAVAFRYLPARGTAEEEIEAAWAASHRVPDPARRVEPALTETA